MRTVVAGLCLLGVLGLVTAAAAQDTPPQVPSVACGVLDLSLEAPLGAPVTTTAALGSTTATLAGTTTELSGIPAIGSPTLTIGDNGVTVRSGPVEAPGDELDVPPPALIPAGIASPSTEPADGDDSVRPLCVARFAGNDRPTVLLGLYTGGAHCCTILRGYPLAASGAGALVDESIGNPGVDVRPEGDEAIVVTADDSFNYEFNAFALSGVPVKVLEFRESAFVDTTHRHLALVRRDADMWWRRFNEDLPRGLGFLAAWVADQCILGEGASAWQTVDRLLAEGNLGGDPDAGESGADYVAKLRTFLSEHGYCR